MRRTLTIFVFTLIAAAMGLFLYSGRGEIREITATTSTSDCIGESTSMICAVETWLACAARMDYSSCRTAVYGKQATTKCADGVGFDDPSYPICNDLDLYEDADASVTHARYRIKDTRKATDAERKEEPWLEDDAPAPAYVVTVERWRCLPQKDEPPHESIITSALPVDSPGESVGHRIRSFKRRLQTVAWEYGLAEEPFTEVWYGVGADYCWVPLTYWVGEKNGEWRVVRWTTAGFMTCESACGCPEVRWPPYRKVDDTECWNEYRKATGQ